MSTKFNVQSHSTLNDSDFYFDRNEAKPLHYEKRIPKLQSIGPLKIVDLDDFLVKAKIDFYNLYKDKSISHFKMSDFIQIRKLGSGSFGQVILARRITKDEDNLYAIKVIDKKAILKSKQFQYVHNEKRIMQALNFPFVVYLKFFFVDFNYLYFAMPFVPGGDFFDFLKDHKPLKENPARFYVSQLVLALEYLHYLELIHRDIKPENIMLDGLGYIKLADFGQCVRCSKNEKAWTMTGTREYMAPEIIKGMGYDSSVDLWAVGVMLYEMCASSRPFQSPDSTKLLKLIVSGSFVMPQHFSTPLKNLVRRLLEGHPTKRIGGENRGASEIKKHEWFRSTDWLTVLNRTLPAPYLPRSSTKN